MMASNAQPPSQAASKKPTGKTATARYLSSTSASSSRAAVSATLVASSSKAKITPVPRPAKPTPRAAAQGTSTLRSSKSASYVIGVAPARASGPKVPGSVKVLASSSSSPALDGKVTPKDQCPMPADTATRDRRDLLTTPDALQQAAQAQSWLYMSASLENSYAATERSAAAALEQQRTELSAQEADIADARVRFDAERLVSFYQELLTPEVAGAITSLVQAFLTHEEACSRTLAGALDLVERPANERLRIRQFNDVLDELDRLLEDAAQLESSIIAIARGQAECVVETSDRPEQSGRLIPALLALLPVVRTRVANLECARTVAQSCKVNIRLATKAQSLQKDV
ncbi:hypothetical protein C8Q72DRAFT_70078 [Fomitopsis betulina]|nr:hypothetical protein C8Q72DRAFT_70078 [Fomitopsis betulina]